MSVFAASYEIRKLHFDHRSSASIVRRVLTDEAEYSGWELSRLRRYRDGSREVWLKRKIIRARSTL